MDAEEGIALINEMLKEEEVEAYKTSLLVWSSSLALYSQGGTPPDPPRPPGTEQDEWVSASDILEDTEYKPKEINTDMSLDLDLDEILYNKA